MDYLLIIIVAFGAAMLTFFSGFGLGTILLPVFTVFFPVEIAIALTAIVHLANNLFKFGLLWKKVNYPVVIRFGMPAAIAAFLGAYTLNVLSSAESIIEYKLFGQSLQTSLIRIIIAILLFIFAVIEINKRLKKLQFSRNLLPLGGLLSGFFGGLSGHQGALRSMFLLRSGLEKEAFIATGIAAAILIDLSRLTVYGTSFFVDKINSIGDSKYYLFVLVAILSAFMGSLIGRQLLKKITMRIVKLSVGILIMVFSLIFGTGII